MGDMANVKGILRTTAMEALIPGRAPATIPHNPPIKRARIFWGRKTVENAAI
jgi:hypothetical protein